MAWMYSKTGRSSLALGWVADGEVLPCTFARAIAVFEVFPCTFARCIAVFEV